MSQLAEAPVVAETQKKAVLWDYDNVLGKTEKIALAAARLLLNDWLAEKGISEAIDETTFQREYVGLTFAKIIDKAASEHGLIPEDISADERQELIERELQGAIQALTTAPREEIESPGAETALRTFARFAIMAVVSSSAPSRLEACMEYAGQLDYIPLERVFSVTDTRWETRPKPYPDIYLKAMEILGLTPDQCIAVEDSKSGIRAALAAGLETIGFVGATPAEDHKRAAQEIFKLVDEASGNKVRFVVDDLRHVPRIFEALNNGDIEAIEREFGRAAWGAAA